MVVEKHCLATCDGPAARTHALLDEEGHHKYRKMLNLRAMRYGGIMSAINSPREFTIDMADRDEPAFRDSSNHCAFLGHNLVTV